MSLAFLHTARPNVAVFEGLMARLAPGVPADHLLLDSVLRAAVGTGAVTDSMRTETNAAVADLAGRGAHVIVCTCSTIGGLAEAAPVPPGVVVLRIDRPMAEHAVASGRRIVIAAALPSTLGPTRALIEQVASTAGRSPTIVDALCQDAWPWFERGDVARYAIEIEAAVARIATTDDVVVLAQASMAPAAPLINARGMLAFASPELGVRAALGLLGRGVA